MFYKQLLEVAEKQLNLHKTLREFRKSGLPAAETVEASLTGMIENSFDEAVKSAVATLDRKVDESRVAEITVALKKDGRVMLNAIASGAKISITVENLDRVSQIPSPKTVEIDQSQEFAERLALEAKIDHALADLGRPALALLTHAKDDE